MSRRLTRPNSLLVRFRRSLARRVDVSPDPGEAWCLRCELNSGRTLIVAADSWTVHARKHVDELPGHQVSVIAAWPTLKNPEDTEEPS